MELTGIIAPGWEAALLPEKNRSARGVDLLPEYSSGFMSARAPALAAVLDSCIQRLTTSWPVSGENAFQDLSHRQGRRQYRGHAIRGRGCKRRSKNVPPGATGVSSRRRSKNGASALLRRLHKCPRTYRAQMPGAMSRVRNENKLRDKG